jgi:anti-sigma factor RsiW
VTCRPELVTGLVDGVLSPADRASLEEHLASCPSCRDQAEFERSVGPRLRALPSPEPRAELLQAVRRRLSVARTPRPWLLPVAAAFFGLLLWGRGAAPFVAWELARDHDHCFAKARLPARVWSSDPIEVARWFEDQGTAVPPLPEGRHGLALVGARYCPLVDRLAAHVYYANDDRRLSVFVFAGPARFSGYELGAEARGHEVRLLRSAGMTVALVSEHADDVAAFRDHFATTTALLEVAGWDSPRGE